MSQFCNWQVHGWHKTELDQEMTPDVGRGLLLLSVCLRFLFLHATYYVSYKLFMNPFHGFPFAVYEIY